MRRILLLIMIISLLFGFSKSQTPITDCTTITSPGTYVLTNDIINSSTTICINIQASNITLDCQGHRIDGVYSPGTYGIYISHYNFIIIKKCVIIEWEYGIYLNNSQNNIIFNNTVNYNRVGGIRLFSSSNNIISNNIVNGNADHGIDILSNSNNNVIKNNIIRDNFNMGLSVVTSANNIISDNIIYNSFTVSDISFGSISNIMYNNIIGGAYFFGINLYHTDNNNISNNTIENNGVGVYLQTSNDNIISNNIIINNNDVGIHISFSYGNRIYNNLFNNTNNYYAESSNYFNTTKQHGPNIVGGPFIGGNYWGNPDRTGFSDTCTDSNGDGFCDIYYVINLESIDYLPLSLNFSRPEMKITTRVFYVNKDFKEVSLCVGDKSKPMTIFACSISNWIYENLVTTTVIFVFAFLIIYFFRRLI